MKIVYAKTAPGSKLEASQQVNKIGKYLYQNIDGAYKYKVSSNMNDVYTIVLYQLPRLQQVPGRQKEGYNDMHEMHLDINITTYQNKIRINIIEITPEETTIGFDLYDPEIVRDMSYAKEVIMNKIHQRISRRYKDYIFLW